MKKIVTGNSEIDKQHEQLDQLIDSLDQVCETKRQTKVPCLSCPPECHGVCNDRLANLIGDLLGFMLNHFSYEEKLMRLLNDTPENRKHIDGHQRAHAEISRLLSELTAKLDRENPRQSAIYLQNIASAWIGRHSEGMDAQLAHALGSAYSTEVDYDIELTKLLAQ